MQLLVYFLGMPPLKRSLTIVDEAPRTKKAKSFKKSSLRYKTKTKSVTGDMSTGVRMPYHTYAQRVFNVGTTMVDEVFRGSSVYDPEYSLGGHQAYGFDQMAALYRDYYVKRSTITVAIVHNTNNASFGQLLIWADTNPNVPPDMTTAVERCMAAGGKKGVIPSFYANPLKLQVSASTKQMLKSGMEEDNNRGSSTTNPQSGWYWHVCTTLEDATLSRNHIMLIDIDYETVWTESNLNATS